MNSPETNSPRIIAGAMSGTSADGVDVALTRIEGRGLDMSAQLLLHHHRAYDAETRRVIFQMRETGNATLRDLSHITREITLTFAAAINEALVQAKLSASDLAAASAHGQTLFHDPPLTMQIFDPSLLAAEVGCAVVSDFRRADLAAAGQGAPLVPFADYVLFRDAKKNRVLLNIGGIANITYIPAGASVNDVIAFDTGPGNCISDFLMRTRGADGVDYDENGQRAFRADYHEGLASRFLEHSYFTKVPPKSTDGPEMIGAWEQAVRAAGCEALPLDELLATACYCTAAAISEATHKYFPLDEIELIASGGGTRNEAIMNWLESADFTAVLPINEIGVASEAKEALAFALLAAATLDGVASNVPSATGAKRAVVLGSITPKQN